MNTKRFFVTTFAVLSTWAVLGCANKQETMVTTNSNSSTMDPSNRTYSNQDLRNTGRAQTGDAVRSLEPSAR